ncbi:MAG: HAD-IA family hydrolase [Kiritimatiellae bacterium]|nr:HAD-IA family hydrolase [Kiritimatiellia bacterium]
MKIRAFVFDFGGVMTPALHPYLVKPLVERLGLVWEKVLEGYGRYRRRMDGDFMTLREMYGRIFGDMGATVGEEDLEEILNADTGSFLERDEKTLSLMRDVKAEGFLVGILTNMNTPFSRRFKRVFADYVELADALVISGEEHLYKPMREIYDLAASRLGVEAGEICFFDDLEENCAAARAAGWKAVRFTNADEARAACRL